MILDPNTITRTSPKKVIQASLKAGWHVTAAEFEVTTTPEPFKSGPRAGEKQPPKTVTHLILSGKTKGAAWQATYWDGRFKDALVQDAAGWPIELWVDYKPTAEKKKQLGAEKAVREGEESSYKYNDGEFFTDYGPHFFSTAADFEQWMADVIPDYGVKKKPVKKVKVTEGLDLIEIGEWSA